MRVFSFLLIAAASAATCALPAGCGSPAARSPPAPAGRAGPAPELVVETGRRDLGDVQSGSAAATTFRIRNAGTAALEIRGVSAGCCAGARFPRRLEPGQRGEITVRYRPVLETSGPVEQRVTVASSDPRQPVATLVFTARVLPFIVAEPPPPLRISYMPGRRRELRVRLRPPRGRGVRLLAARSSSPRLRAALSGSGPEYRLLLEVGAGREAGDLTARVQVRTSEAKMPVFTVPVQALAQAGPVGAPPRLELPDLEAARGLGYGADGTPAVAGRVSIFTRAGMLRVLAVETGMPAFHAALTPRGTGGFYNVDLTYQGGLRPGRFEGKLVVRTDYAPAPLLVVPFSGRIR